VLASGKKNWGVPSDGLRIATTIQQTHRTAEFVIDPRLSGHIATGRPHRVQTS
jgi:hypothetical protein